MKYDVAVVGLGAMGSASTWAMTRRGATVIAFDQLEPPHRLGSTHGYTRIIREAYYEHPLYVPLVRRAYDVWAELERESGEQLLRQTGGVMVGPQEGPLVRGASESARTHGIDHEMLDAAELNRRFPAYRADPAWVALLERRAGMLFPERCVTAFIDAARTSGAALHVHEPVTRWTTSARGARVETAKGTYDAERVVVAAGPWLPTLDSVHRRVPVEIERQLSHWFEPAAAAEKYSASHCPVGLWETRADDVFATIPDEGHGVKCGTHHAGAATTAGSVSRRVTDTENAAAAGILDRVMPGAAGRLLDARVCLYTNTPDRHFIIDWDTGERALIVSPCSGHGFKFASAIGEIVSQLVLDGRSWLDLAPFSLSRFH